MVDSCHAWTGNCDHEGDVLACREHAGHHVTGLADPPQADLLGIDIGMCLHDLDRIEDDLGPLMSQVGLAKLPRGFTITRLVPGEDRVAGTQHALHDWQVIPEKCAVNRPGAMHEQDDRERAGSSRCAEIADELELTGLEGDLLGPGRLRRLAARDIACQPNRLIFFRLILLIAWRMTMEYTRA